MTAIIDTSEIPPLLDAIKRELENAMVDIGEDTLKFMAEKQIESYTSTSRPSQPSGSGYRRTFRTQRSSQRRMTSRKFPVMGDWNVMAAWASFVVGEQGQQAGVHVGRWQDAETTASQGEDFALKKSLREVSVITKRNSE